MSPAVNHLGDCVRSWAIISRRMEQAMNSLVRWSCMIPMSSTVNNLGVCVRSRAMIYSSMLAMCMIICVSLNTLCEPRNWSSGMQGVKDSQNSECQTSFIRFETWTMACSIYQTHTFNYLNNFVKAPLVTDLQFLLPVTYFENLYIGMGILPSSTIWYFIYFMEQLLTQTTTKACTVEEEGGSSSVSLEKVLIHWMFLHWIVAKLDIGKWF